MGKVIADPENEKHAPLIKAAFGDKADLNIVKENIRKLKNDDVAVKLPAVPGTTIAYTQYSNSVPMVAQHIEFGEKYHQCV